MIYFTYIQYFRKVLKLGIKIKNWGDPSMLSFHDCPICVKQGVETIKIQKRTRKNGGEKQRSKTTMIPNVLATILFCSI